MDNTSEKATNFSRRMQELSGIVLSESKNSKYDEQYMEKSSTEEKPVISETKQEVKPVIEESKTPTVQAAKEATAPEKTVPSQITPAQIKALAEEISKINKKIDFRNPVISESKESLVETLMFNIRSRELNVDKINEGKQIVFKREDEKSKMQYLINYNKLRSDEDK